LIDSKISRISDFVSILIDHCLNLGSKNKFGMGMSPEPLPNLANTRLGLWEAVVRSTKTLKTADHQKLWHDELVILLHQGARLF